MGSAIMEFFQNLWDYICIPWSWIKLIWSHASEKKYLLQQGYIEYPHFAKVDKEFTKAYQYLNPYQITQTYSSQKKDSSSIYGETPLHEIARVWRYFHLYDSPLVFDLGAGRGRLALFLSYALSMKVIAVEKVPLFCEKLRKWKSPLLSVLEADFFSIKYEKPALIYLYGTCLNEPEILLLIKNFLKNATPLQILTTSYPLDAYSSAFTTQGEMLINFPWGKTKIYLNKTSSFKQILQKRI